ncbi:MAG: DUF1800 domain-containing protein [Verrucomicrobiota bacterium]|nr:DUF1800 domain-containing protein [Verrucomicrobiota bacterium]
MLTPLPAQKWTFRTAAHLLNRAGFGAIPEEIEAAQRAGMEATVKNFLHPPADPPAAEEDDAPWRAPENLTLRRGKMRALRNQPGQPREKIREMANESREELLEVGLWWLERMRKGRAPLVEKMTLFWHGHFATSGQKIRNSYWMWRQNETFRRHALGNFSTLLHEISRDPAMMIYLDLAQSKKSRPNENWAREVMELFTLGIGHYTEMDIRESARAFTGYRLNLRNQKFRYEPALHDAGRKTFLGQTGNFSGDDILELIVQRPACPAWIARKLCRFFVQDEPVDSLVSAVAGSLRKHDLELRPVLQELFRAEEFYADAVIGAQIKSPIQFLVQTCRLLESDLPPTRVTLGALRQMGQIPLAPPNVKGWDGGKSWISTSTLLFRYNFAHYLLSGTEGHPKAPAALRRAAVDLSPIAPAKLRDDPAALVAWLSRWFYQAPASPAQTATFLAYLKSKEPDRSDQTIRHLLHLMMSTPQYQLT